MSEQAAASGGRRLKVGDSVGVFEVTHADDRRIRLGVPIGMPVTLLVLGGAALLFDLMLLHAGFRPRILRAFPKIVQVALLFMPLLAIFGLFMIGHSYDFDAGSDRVERRRTYRVTGQFRVADVAAIVLNLTTPSRDTVVELQLVDPQGKVLLSEFREELGGTNWPATLHLASDLSRTFKRPIRVEGEFKEGWPTAKEAIEAIHATGNVPEDIRVIRV